MRRGGLADSSSIRFTESEYFRYSLGVDHVNMGRGYARLYEILIRVLDVVRTRPPRKELHLDMVREGRKIL